MWVVIGIALFVILFRQQIKDLLPRLTGIKTKIFSIELAKPGAQVQSLQKDLNKSGIRPPEKPLNLAKQTPRDAVFESWGCLKQAVYDFYKVHKGTFPPLPGSAVAAKSLKDDGLISPQIYDIIVTLNTLGQKLEEDTRSIPDEEGAQDYVNKASVVRVWLMTNLTPPVTGGDIEDQPMPPSRDKTSVGGAVPQPGRGPIAVLEVVEGPLRGKTFTVDNAHFRIGSNSDNDLVLWEDEFVSRHHASLRHENGALYLYDENSRNGTLLNDNRIADRAAVFRGDRIAIGHSVFKVSEAPRGKEGSPNQTTTR
jgi:hypothetical protein